MAGHTPRPWYVYELEGYSWAVIGPLQTMRESSFKHKADADLIAAAPDMLEALEGLTNGWGEEQPCFCLPTWDRRGHMSRCEKARAAIAKAKEGATMNQTT